MSFKLRLVKHAVNIIASYGVARLVDNFFKTTTTVFTRRDRIRIFIGSAVLGAIVVDHARVYVNEKFDEVVEWWKKHKDDNLNGTA